MNKQDPKLIDMTNKRFGKLLVIERGEKDKGPPARWVCLCDCGITKTIGGSDLRKGRTISCGCHRQKIRIKHGAFIGGKDRKHPRTGYLEHKIGATFRGIPFLLTFEEWWKIWEDSGHWENKGTKMGQFVMARTGDKGPYAIGNVRITTAEDNHREFKHTKEHKAKLSKIMKGNQYWRKN